MKMRPFTLSLSAVFALSACEAPFPEEPVRSFQDFGTELYGIIYDEFRRSGSLEEGQSRADAFAVHREDLIPAFNRLTEGKVNDGILPLLEEFLPLYEVEPDGRQGPLPALTRDTSSILKDLAANEGLIEALARLNQVPDSNPGALTRLLGSLVRHPAVDVDALTRLVLEAEPHLTELTTWLYRELPTLEESLPEHAEELTFFQRLLHEEILFTDEVVGPPVWSARLDSRGAPVVQQLGSGAWPFPFVDTDGDQRVDVDVHGMPIDAEGRPIYLPVLGTSTDYEVERDQAGRVSRNGHYLYEYFDLRRSLLAFVLRDVGPLLAQGTHHDAMEMAEYVLGWRRTFEDQDGSYTGFDANDSPLLELVHQLTELARYERLVPLMHVLERFSQDKNPLFRQLLTEFARARAILQEAPSLAANNALLEDLQPALAYLAKTGGLRAFLAASRKPDFSGMFPAMATMMRHSALSLPNDMSLLKLHSDVDELRFLSPVDWSTPDTEDAQRSWLQKAAYLLADTKGTPVYLRIFDRIEDRSVVITENMAQFYVRSIADQAFLQLTPEFLTTTAIEIIAEFDDHILQAEELNLYMNHDQTVTGNPIGNRGIQVRLGYGPALLALQASGNLKAMRPWIRDLVALGGEDGFVDLFDVLARHYSESEFIDGPFVSDGTGFRKWEPYLVQILEETQLPRLILEFSAWADSTSLTYAGETFNIADELDAFLNWVLTPENESSLRSGAQAFEGKRGTITKPSRLQYLLHAFDLVDQVLEGQASAKAAWERIDLLGIYLDTDEAGQLKNRHVLDMFSKLLPILSREVSEAVAENDWLESIDELRADVATFVESRGMAGLFSLMRFVRENPEHKAMLDRLLLSFFEEEPLTPSTDLRGNVLEMIASLSQLRLDIDVLTRTLRFAGDLLEPSRRMLFTPLEALQKIRAFDEDKVTTALMENLFAEVGRNHTSLSVLVDGFKSPLRQDPSAEGPYEPRDYQVIIQRVSDWLVDSKKGMEHMYEVIRGR